jgi:cell division protein FtsB
MKIFIAVVCIFGWLFLITVVHVSVIRSGRVVSKLQQEVEVKEARNQYEQLEISRLSSPEAITTYAQEHMGFVQPEPHEIILLDESK